MIFFTGDTSTGPGDSILLLLNSCFDIKSIII